MVRKVIIPIDSVLEMFKDYTSANREIPEDAMPVSLQVKPAEQGMFAIMAEGSFPDDTPMRVDFDIKRVYSA